MSVQRTGFSLVEVLCLIAIVGILTAMALPGIQSIRESARRLKCVNKLRQIGLSAANFESVNNRLPPGTLGFNRTYQISERDTSTSTWSDDTDPAFWKNSQHTSSLVLLLPFLDRNNIFQSLPKITTNTRINYGQFRRHETSAPAWIGNIESIKKAMHVSDELFLCPSDNIQDAANTGVALVSAQFAFDRVGGVDWMICEPDFWNIDQPAATSYVGCSGAHSAGFQVPEEFAKFRGAMTCRENISIADIQDGSSNTILFGENIGSITNGKRKYFFPWMFGGIARGRSNLPWQKDILEVFPEYLLLGDAQFAHVSGFGSKHPSVVNFVFSDGSTRPISRLTHLEPWYALCGAFDGETVDY